MRILREKWATKGEGKGAEKELNARENNGIRKMLSLYNLFESVFFKKKNSLKNGNAIFWNGINL